MPHGKINSMPDALKTDETLTIPDLAELTGKSERTIST